MRELWANVKWDVFSRHSLILSEVKANILDESIPTDSSLPTIRIRMLRLALIFTLNANCQI